MCPQTRRNAPRKIFFHLFTTTRIDNVMIAPETAISEINDASCTETCNGCFDQSTSWLYAKLKNINYQLYFYVLTWCCFRLVAWCSGWVLGRHGGVPGSSPVGVTKFSSTPRQFSNLSVVLERSGVWKSDFCDNLGQLDVNTAVAVYRRYKFLKRILRRILGFFFGRNFVFSKPRKFLYIFIPK